MRCFCKRGSRHRITFAGYAVTGSAAPPLAAERWCARQQARIGQALQVGAALPVHTVAPSSIIACRRSALWFDEHVLPACLTAADHMPAPHLQHALK